MISCFNKKINSFNENNLKSFYSYKERNSYIQSLMPDISDIHKNVCPCCHAKNKLIKYGKYVRNISFLVDNNFELVAKLKPTLASINPVTPSVADIFLFIFNLQLLFVLSASFCHILKIIQVLRQLKAQY